MFKYLPALASALIVGAFGLLLHGWLSMRAEMEHEARIKQVQAAMEIACAKKQRINNEVEDDYQKSLTALAAELAAARSVRAPTCVPVIRSAICPNQKEDDTQLPRGDEGISRDYLLDFAARAEQVGLQLDALQDWVSRTLVK